MPSNLEILAYEHTELGPLCLRRRRLLSRPGSVVTEITLGHRLLMSSRYTVSEERLAEAALEMHAGSDLHVLVGGLGLGYTARAALTSSRVMSVHALELLPQVIDWMERGLVPLSPLLRKDERLSVSEGGSAADCIDLGGRLRNVFDDVTVEPVTFFNDLVGVERTDWLFLAS